MLSEKLADFEGCSSAHQLFEALFNRKNGTLAQSADADSKNLERAQRIGLAIGRASSEWIR